MEVKKLGFLQALGVTVYCSLVGILFWQGPQVFQKPNQYFFPVMFLLLFSVSALVCGLLVFYKPYKLFFSGNLPAGRQGKKEAIRLVVYTSLWLFLFLIISFLLMIFFK